MSNTVSNSIDHEAPWRNTVSAGGLYFSYRSLNFNPQLSKLAKLSSYKISPFRVKAISGGQLIVGGFGDVQQVKIRSSLFQTNPLVALKKLRPAGDRNQRIRVMAVCIPCASTHDLLTLHSP